MKKYYISEDLQTGNAKEYWDTTPHTIEEIRKIFLDNVNEGGWLENPITRNCFKGLEYLKGKRLLRFIESIWEIRFRRAK